MAIDADDLAADVAPVVAAQEDDQVGDFLGVDETLHRNSFGVERPNVAGRHGFDGGMGCDDSIHAIAVDIAGRDAIDPDVVWAELHRERLGKPGGRPFGRGVRATGGVTHNSCSGNQIHDGAMALCLEDGNNSAGTEELRVDANGHGCPPLVVGYVFDEFGGASDPGIVHQYVQASRQDLVEDLVESP